jgi:ABC-type multidrug transport system permease subunit
MNRLKTFFRQYAVFSKRLLKNPVFLMILLLVPLLVGAIYMAADGEKGGIVTVALAMKDDSDPVACAVTQKLMSGSSLIRFVMCGSADEAETMVTDGHADGAWIFPRDMAEQTDVFANHTHKNNSFIKVIQREDSILLNISREKLNAAVYPYLSRSLYRSFLDRLDGMENITGSRADDIYDSVQAEGEDLFEFVYDSSDTDVTAAQKNGNYILSPLRGMLAIMVLFAGMASTLFYARDEQRGVFDRQIRSSGFALRITYHLSAVIMAAAAALGGLVVMGLTAGFFRELAVMMLYALCTVGFCICIHLLIKSIRLLCALSPLLIVITSVMCPVFFMTPDLPAVQYLLPTHYYLVATTDRRILPYMLLYCTGLYILAFLLDTFRTKHRRRNKTTH